MSAMKRYAEDVSVEMGFHGELTDAVLVEAQRRLDEMSEPVESDHAQDTRRAWGSAGVS